MNSQHNIEADEKLTLLASQPPFPKPDDDSTTVRAYLAPLIARTFDLDNTEATQLAQRWKYSKGAALKDYDDKAYREIFGTEEGIILKKAVADHDKECYWLEVQGKKPWLGPLADPKRDGLRNTVIVLLVVLGAMSPVFLMIWAMIMFE